MKDIFEPYLNKRIILEKSHRRFEHLVTLFRITDSYFALRDDSTYESVIRYVPYSSIFEIVERKGCLEVSLQDLDVFSKSGDSLCESRADEMIEEICNVKGCIIGNTVPLGELVRKSNEITDEMKSIKVKMDSIQRAIGKVEASIRFI